MSDARMKLTGPDCRRALAMVKKQPGIERKEIARQLGCGHSKVGELIRALRGASLIGAVSLDRGGDGRARGWYTREALPAAIAEARRITKQKQEARGKRASAVRRARGRKAEPVKGKVKFECDGMPVQRIISAGSKRPLPFLCSAPNSVFALGGQA